ncbi:hypothetical protein HY605_05065 [Candidatus Peregrinibacteria bacterium]|nr:hypothetical protein [Candidatus Peregrinibacteria bacterium]
MAVEFNADYYKTVLDRNGYQSLRDQVKPIDFSLGTLTPPDLSLLWLCHHGADEVVKTSAETGSRIKVVTGIGLSGTPHLGTLSQILKAIKLQQFGNLAVKFVLGDLDAYGGKNTPLAYARKLGEQVRRFMLDIGFDDSGRNELRDQYDELEILRTMYLSGYFMEEAAFGHAEEDLHGFYAGQGKVDEGMTFRRKLSLALMVAGWIHQLIENGDDHVLIMLGIDEHQYVRFGQEVLEKMRNSEHFRELLADKRIAAMYSTLIGGFNGYPKMSKSFPKSGIHLGMSRVEIADLVLREAKKDCPPEENVIFQCMASASTYSPAEIRERYDECQGDTPTWEEMKRAYVEHLGQLIDKWRKHEGSGTE